MRVTLSELSALLGGKTIAGDNNFEITGFASLIEALPGDVTFYEGPKHRAALLSTKASAVVVGPDFAEKMGGSTGVIRVEEPSSAFCKLVERFAPPRPEFVSGVHESASVDSSARLAVGVSVRANAVVEARARIGSGTEIGAGAVIGESAVIGENCRIHPNATVAWGCVLGNNVTLHSGSVVGADGFGYEFVDGRHRKVEQLGIAVIGDDVEIGASTTIDRARFGRTHIGEGTKIDNQVQVGHNTIIGRHCIIIAGVDIAGSARIGDHVIIAAQAGVAGHLEIADRAVLAARTGVTKSITKPGNYMGFPHQPASDERKQIVRLRQLGDVMARLKRLEDHAGAPPAAE